MKKVSKINSKKIFGCIGASVLSLVLVCTLVVSLVTESTLEAFAAEKNSDDSTAATYTASLGDNASTEYAGRLWTDKSVYSEEKVVFGDNDYVYEAVNDSDFLVAYSALGTSQSVQGLTVAPVDVVFVIDMSGSMEYAMSQTDSTSRISGTVKAVNKSIESIMALNQYTRIAVVGYSSNATVWLPLDHYTKAKGSDSFISLKNSSVSVNAVSSSNTKYSKSYSVTGGTNTQIGMYTGMNILATADSTTVNINGQSVQRVPSVILLSDGSATYSSGSTSWWAPADNSNNGSGSNAYAGNGMKLMMTASYMKDEIDRHYGVTGTSFATTVYTVGMGITGLSNNSLYLANISLNPAQHWNDDNSIAKDIRTDWTTYSNNNFTGEPSIEVNYNKKYKLTHPPKNDIDSINKYVDKYYDANSATSVANVFSDIVNSIKISHPQVPTKVSGDDPFTDGYVTYTDPIGKYMEVKDINTILYGGSVFTNHSKVTSDDGKTTTYVFDGTINNEIYGEHELKYITITVTTDDYGNQTLTVKIPAASIPLRINTVTLNSDGTVKTHTNNGVVPMRVLYTVGLRDGVVENGVVSEEVSDDYIAANLNEDGTVNFYSNLYSGNKVDGLTVGDATVKFVPSESNPFYYMSQNTVLYLDEECTIPAKADVPIDDNTKYYYKEKYYHGSAIEELLVERTGNQISLVNLIETDEGYWARKAGSPRINRIHDLVVSKSDNSTQTAEMYYYPSYDAENEAFTVYLGNNGVTKIAAVGTLEVSKTVTADDGITAPSNAEFTFTINLMDKDDEPLNGSFAYTVKDTNGNAVSDASGNPISGTISNGGTITLKDGQTAVISQLPPDSKYTVTEGDVAGFTTTIDGKNTKSASGTVTAGKISTADFVNNYSVTPVTVDGSTAFNVSKKLDGRDWKSTDKFAFLLSSLSGGPLPENGSNNYATIKSYTVAGLATAVISNVPEGSSDDVSFNFGDIKYTKSGKYEYLIVELLPEDSIQQLGTIERLAGVTYTKAVYKITVTVVDNGDGTLKATSSMVQVRDELGAEIAEENQEVVKDNVAEFSNKYDAQSVSYAPRATKLYQDNSDNKPLTDGMFTFTLKAKGGKNDEGKDIAVENIPMPTEGQDKAYNIDYLVSFGEIAFKTKDIGNTYYYEISEVIPNGATNNNDGTYTLNGMTYDANTCILEVKVEAENDVNGNHVVKITTNYDNENESRYESYNGYIKNSRAYFLNTYTPSSVTLTGKTAFNGTKTIVGRDMNSGEEFDFTLEAADDTTKAALENDEIIFNKDKKQEKDTATVSGGKNNEAVPFNFGTAEFTKPGIYKFNIKEASGYANGVLYDSHTCTAIVTVSDINGELKASVVYDNGQSSSDTEKAVFTNKYEATFDDSTAVNLNGTKKLTGQALEQGEFYFEITAENGAPLGDSYAENGNTAGLYDSANDVYVGDITLLKNISYSKAGTYTYVINEVIPADDAKRKGMTYDDSIYSVTVTVTDDFNGRLYVSDTVIQKTSEGKTEIVDQIVFNNKYKPSQITITPYTMTKVLEGDRAEKLKDGEFTFVKEIVSAEPSDGIILSSGKNSDTTANQADGTVQFGDITFTKAGTYTVKISEFIPAENDKDPSITYDEHIVESEFSVVDDGNGSLVVTRTSTTGDRTFINTYSSTGTLDGKTNLKVVKTFTGRPNNEWLESDKFTFELAVNPDDQATVEAFENGYFVFSDKTLTVNKANKDNAYFGDITFKKPGTYKFTVTEQNDGVSGIIYDTATRNIVVIVTDNSDGTMTVELSKDSDSLKFTNTYSTDETALDGKTNLAVEKIFTGRPNDEWLNTDTFSFILSAGDDATQSAIESDKIVMPETTLTVDNTNKSNASFGNILFKTPGTYKFTVTEKKGNIDGVTYDTTPRNITVNVVDNNDGTLTAKLSKDSDSLKFTNTYSTTEITLDGGTNLSVEKVFIGRQDNKWLETDEFTFMISAGDDATENAIKNKKVVMPSDTTITVNNKNKDNAHLGDITFKQTGTYKFTVTEKKGNIDGVTYDTTPRNITVNVVDNNDGTLTAELSKDSDSLKFTNTYSTTEIPLDGGTNLSVEKVFIGRQDNKWLETDEFIFVISAGDDATENAIKNKEVVMPNDTAITVNNKNKDNAHFGDITFKQTGTYKFTVTEKKGNIDGVTYDTTPRNITVNVVDNNDGTLTAKLSKDSDSLKFTNTYSTTEITLDGETNLSVEKVFIGRQDNKWLETDEFIFVISAGDDATENAIKNKEVVMPNDTAITVNNKNKDNAHFGDITFKQTGTYKFTVTEKKGNIDGVTYDTTPRNITVNVVDNNDGTLTAKLSKDSDSLKFTNTYSTTEITLDGETNLSVEKVFIGRQDNKWLETDEFTFMISAGDDATENAIKNKEVVMPNDTTITVNNKNKDNAHFGDITFKQAGVYKFTVIEKKGNIDGVTYDTTPRNITVNVVDNNDGTLTAKLSKDSDSLKFTNTYSTTEITLDGETNLSVEKVFIGRQDNKWLKTDEFTFVISAGDDATENAIKNKEVVMPNDTAITVNNKNKDNAHFGDITFKQAGVYKFTVIEKKGNIDGVTYDTTPRNITVNVVDNNDGTLTAKLSKDSDSLKFTNTYSTTEITLDGGTNLSVEKVFIGRQDNKWLETDEFTFMISAGDDATENAIKNKNVVMPSDTAITVNNKNKNNAHFGDITFKRAGTYKFTVTEKKGNIDGVTYDTTPRNITVNVVDNNDGILTAKLSKDNDSLRFTNTYSTNETTLDGQTNLKVTKVLEGREWLTSDLFTFKLSAGDDNTSSAIKGGIVELPKSTELTISGKDEVKEKNFGDIKFTEAGTYSFVVSEEVGDINGIVYDTHSAKITVEVTDNNVGGLTASISNTIGSMVFKNSFTASPVNVVFNGTKRISGRDVYSSDIFEFTVSRADNMPDTIPLPSVTTVNNNANGEITFAPFTYMQEGTFEYVIKETGGSASRVLNDTGEVHTKVDVTYDEASNALVADVTYTKINGNNGGEGFEFINIYSTEPTDNVTGFSALKIVTASDSYTYDMKNEEFSFRISPSADNPTSDPISENIVTNDGNGNIVFASNVQFTEPGTYTYTVNEINTIVSGILYDDSVYVISVEVTESSTSDKLEANVNVTKNGKKVDGIVFENQYNPLETSVLIYGEKLLDGKTLEAGEFSFKLVGEENAPMPTNNVAVNTKTGTFSFGTVTYKAPGTYKYAISEINDGREGYSYDDTVYNIIVTVTDDNGSLKAEINGLDEVVFNNSYEPFPVTLVGETAISGVKTLEGRNLKNGEFEFLLIDSNGNIVTETNNDANGNFSFEPITFNNAGTYIYTIVEKDTKINGVTYDTNKYNVVITVEDKGGYLEAVTEYTAQDGKALDSVTFTNTFKAESTHVQLNAVKQLDGREMNEGEFSFVIKNENGEVVLTAENDKNGFVQFDELVFDSAGVYEYTVSEVQGNAENVTYDNTIYRVTVTVEDDQNGTLNATVDFGGKIMIFKNTYKEPPISTPDEPSDETSSTSSTTSESSKPSSSSETSTSSTAVTTNTNSGNTNNSDNSVTTGDTTSTVMVFAVMTTSVFLIAFLLLRKKNRE